MDSSNVASVAKKTGLSTEDVGFSPSPTSSPNSANSPTGSENGSSLDNHKKKVGQLRASTCENPHGAFFICEHGHPVFRTLSCHARFDVDCPYCAYKWRRNAKKNFSKRVSQMEFPAFVTLTLKKPIKHVLQDLNDLVQLCRKYLRRKGYKIRGCVSCIEPPNHTHAIWDCTYIPQKKLSEVWKTVTGDSFIVDIRKVEKHRWRGAVNDLAKYINKISERGSSVGFNGVHIITSWGDGGYYKKMRMVCKLCGSYFELLWFCGQVDDIDNDDVEFVEIDPG